MKSIIIFIFGRVFWIAAMVIGALISIVNPTYGIYFIGQLIMNASENYIIKEKGV
jgi:hypothetical protein